MLGEFFLVSLPHFHEYTESLVCGDVSVCGL